MDARLMKAAQAGNINALYDLIRQEADVLEGIDNIAFAETPLHTAASAGHTHFAIEIMSLKPSLGRKLNPDGLSPLDLALRKGRTETVRQLVKFYPDLIRVRGRERLTPLHYVAEKDEVDLLAQFLVACPASIKDVTIRGETALHIAVRNGKINAFQVILGWLQRTNKEDVLNCRDEKGNKVLHVAALTNQPQACSQVHDLIYFFSAKFLMLT
ncbi:hypothetical protein RJ640_000267 [Escallonia rubra]|uniref:Ankyrin repeat-containing protein BDA1-like n=1 Tax=Escallonia rubra TaxID=112253 RepID=A0AA88QJQ2_9ASTE|nr:hypothetical protein RJ640_000267 [Escallonia rubra]